MLTIRLARVGKINKAQFKVVLQEKTIAPGGRHVEILGSYDPHLKQAILKEERIKYWISKGAQASDTAYNLLISKGVISGKKKPVKLPVHNTSPSDADGPKKAEETKLETSTTEVKTEEKKEENKAE